MIGGRTKAGIAQIIMIVVSIIFDITIIGLIIGIPLAIAAWIWGLVTGIQMVTEGK